MRGSGQGAPPDASITRSAPAERARSGRWLTVYRVEVLHSPDADAVGRAVVVDRRACPIGRGAGDRGDPREAGLALRDPELSGAHAAVIPDGDGHRLVDRGSRNGTFLDGARVDDAPLASGAVIRAGGSVLLFERLDLPEDVELAREAPPLLGRSVAMQQLRAEIARVARWDLPVLVLGETGVGKELVARALHERSGRSGAFVPVNCGALPAELIEAELFGNVAGAYTSADRARDGLFAAAEGGTLLLDEIGEMPTAAQPALLRALATGEVRPVGGERARRVDTRVIAATHRDLAGAVGEGSFRADLLARLEGWVFRVPPLRERRADVLALARHFLARGGDPPPIAADAAEALCLHDWPANVRALEQAIAAARIRADGDELRLSHLDATVGAPIRARRAPADAGRRELPLALLVDPDAVPDAAQLRQVFARLDGNVAQVASFFGKDRRQIYRWLTRHGLDIDELR